jgi:glycosyltransferase involved in cell wall biosynthesis
LEKLSVIIPCYNEEHSIEQVIEKVIAVVLPKDVEMEIIVVDDCSTDQSRQKAENSTSIHSTVQLLSHPTNRGKGACIKTGLAHCSGTIVLIQDADFEYDPRDYNKLLEPILSGYADVVYGSRFIGNGPHRILFYFHTIGNKFLTSFSNLFTQLNLTDMETGYKMFRKEIINQIKLREERFGFEPEVTAKISRIKNIRIYEVGISYFGRTYNEGKKITWRDGIRTLYCILKYNLFAK